MSQTTTPCDFGPGRVVNLEELQKRFTYHAPYGDQPDRYVRLREAAQCMAITILFLTRPSREQSVALTKLEEVAFWANAGIARNEPRPPDYVQPDAAHQPLPEFQARVILEKLELDKRATALSDFIERADARSDFIGMDLVFKDLPPDEQERMKVQNDLMWQLSEVLGARIAAFLPPV